jgi:hypothetical protein
MPDRYRAPGGWRVQIVRLECTPDHRDGTWIRVTQYGSHVESSGIAVDGRGQRVAAGTGSVSAGKVKPGLTRPSLGEQPHTARCPRNGVWMPAAACSKEAGLRQRCLT